MDLVLTRGRKGVQDPENVADVLCTRPLTLYVAHSSDALNANFMLSGSGTWWFLSFWKIP